MVHYQELDDFDFLGNSQSVLWNIIKRHVKPFRNHGGASAQGYGKGLYLYDRPDIYKSNNKGVVACRVLIGRVFKGPKEPNDDDPPGGHQTKHIHVSNANSFYVVPNPDQILPLAVIHSGRDVATALAGPTEQGKSYLRPHQFTIVFFNFHPTFVVCLQFLRVAQP